MVLIALREYREGSCHVNEKNHHTGRLIPQFAFMFKDFMGEI